MQNSFPHENYTLKHATAEEAAKIKGRVEGLLAKQARLLKVQVRLSDAKERVKQSEIEESIKSLTEVIPAMQQIAADTTHAEGNPLIKQLRLQEMLDLRRELLGKLSPEARTQLNEELLEISKARRG